MLIREIPQVHKMQTSSNSHDLNLVSWLEGHSPHYFWPHTSLFIHMIRVPNLQIRSLSAIVLVCLSVMLSFYYWMLVTLLLNWKMCCMLSLSLTTNYPLTIYKRQWCLYWVSFSLLCRTGTWDVLWGPHEDILYLLEPDRELRTLLVTASAGEQISSGVWHQRMGHPWSKS